MSNPNIAFFRGQDGALVLGGYVDGAPVVATPGAVDAMADLNGTNLEAHTPDSGFTSWAESTTGGITIQTNKAQAAVGVLGGADGVLASPGIVNDNYSYYADIKPAGTGALPGLRFRSDSTLGTATATFLLCRLAANPETSVTITLIRWGVGAALETFTVVTGLNLGSLFTNGIRLGVDVSGNTVQVWTMPYGGGTRTNRGTLQTFSTGLNDSSHKYFGLVRTSNGEIGTTWDNVTVVTGAASGALTLTIGSVSGALNGEIATGDTFTIVGETGSPVHTVTSGWYKITANAATISFTTALASDIAPGTAVSFTVNSIAQARMWNLRGQETPYDSTVMGNTSRHRMPGVTTFTGQGEAYLDYADLKQKALLDRIVSASPATAADVGILFRVASKKQFYGNALLSNLTITTPLQGLVTVTFDFESNDTFLLDWTA